MENSCCFSFDSVSSDKTKLSSCPEDLRPLTNFVKYVENILKPLSSHNAISFLVGYFSAFSRLSIFL